MLALDLDVIEAMRELEALDLGALHVGGAVGDQREFDAACLERVDRIMRTGEHEDRFFAIGREAVGEAIGEIVGEGAAAVAASAAKPRHAARGRTRRYRTPPERPWAWAASSWPPVTAADTSRADVVAVTGGRERVLRRLPVALHDAAGVAIGGSLYLFGRGRRGAAARSDPQG